MLTAEQRETVGDRMISAEVRSLYFGDLASLYSRRKHWITGLSFFLSSGAAATLIAKAPAWVPIVLSVIVAAITAYSMSVNLDSLTRLMAKLHYSWNEIANDYERLWSSLDDEGAESTFEQLSRRERDLSELATTDAPHDKRRLERWQAYVWDQRQLPTA